MKNSLPSLESKTVRPGLSPYSFSNPSRHLERLASAAKPVKRTSRSKLSVLAIFTIILIAVTGATAVNINDSPHKSGVSAGAGQKYVKSSKPASSAITTAKANNCAKNVLPQFVTINITKRHLWVCEGSRQVRDYPVITGMQNVADNATPPGTYQVYAKQQDTVLTGTASTGSWNQPVSFWMPFLDNEHGTYGFHDASWRQDSEFGKIDPSSTLGSHGCIQMSVESSEWLYNWANVGTTVTISL